MGAITSSGLDRIQSFSDALGVRDFYDATASTITGKLISTNNSGNPYISLLRATGADQIGLFADNTIRFTTNSSEIGRFTTSGLTLNGALSITYSGGAGANIYGYDVVGASARNGSGGIKLGNTAAFQGLINYSDAGNTILSIDNSYDNASGRIQFRVRTAGTPVVPFWFDATAATLNTTLSMGTNAISSVGAVTSSFDVQAGLGTSNTQFKVNAGSGSWGGLQLTHANSQDWYIGGLVGGDLQFHNASDVNKIYFSQSGDATFAGAITSGGQIATSISGNNSAVAINAAAAELDIAHDSDNAGAYALIRFRNWGSVGGLSTSDGTYIQSITNANNNTDLVFGRYQNGGGGSEILRLKNDLSATFAGTINSGAITSSEIVQSNQTVNGEAVTFRGVNTTTGATYYSSIRLGHLADGSADRLMLASNNSTGDVHIGNLNNYNLKFFTNGIANTRLTIDGTGNATFAGNQYTVGNINELSQGVAGTGVYINGDRLGVASGTDNSATLSINLYGYNYAGAQYRDLLIGDGKGGSILTLTGLTRAATFAGTGTFGGNVLPGTTASYDLGVTGTRWRNLWLSGDVTAAGNATFVGTVSAHWSVDLATAGHMIDSGNDYLLLHGNVGIHQDTPTYVLEVGADAKMDAGLLIAGSNTHGATLEFRANEESPTATTGGTKVTAANVLPAKSIILGVSIRVIAGTGGRTIGDVYGTSSSTSFLTANVVTTVGNTDPGTKSCPYYNATAQTVTINFGGVTGESDQVSIVVHYYKITPPTS